MHRWLAATRVVMNEIGVVKLGNIFLFFITLSSLFVPCSIPWLFWKQPPSSQAWTRLLNTPGCSEAAVSCVYLQIVVFSFPSQCWRSTSFDCKTNACLDAVRQPKNYLEAKFERFMYVQVLGSVNMLVVHRDRLFKHSWTLPHRATCETPPFTPAVSAHDPSFRFYGRAEVTLSPVMFHGNIRGCQGCVLRKLPWSYVYGSLLDFLAKHTKQNILHF